MKNNWYEQRDKRTDALGGVTDTYKRISVAIIVKQDAKEIHIQRMLLLTVNVLSRWCSKLKVSCDDAISLWSPSHLGRDRSLLVIVKDLVHSIDPNASIQINNGIDDCDFHIYIGNPEALPKKPFVSIDCNGWIASCGFNQFVSCSEGITDHHNPLSAAFAACVANAEVFRCAVGMYSKPYTLWYSLLNNETSSVEIKNESLFRNDLDLGRLHIVGCGAIGSSFIFLLRLTEWTGNALLADLDQQVELHNTSSSLLFLNDHVGNGKNKVEIGQEFLSGSKLFISKFDGDYANYSYDHKDAIKGADLILCFANDKNIWSTIQHLYPPVTFHATTSSSWGVNIGRHIPLKDECIYCTFRELMKGFHVPVCAEVKIPSLEVETVKPEEKPAAILPFLAPMAAIITMAEVYKLYVELPSPENSLQFNMGSSTGSFVADHFKPFTCEVCKDQHPEIYSQLNKDTLFWRMSV